MMEEIWRRPEIVRHARRLLDEYRRWTGHELVECAGSESDRARALFHAPAVVLSHGNEPDPILDYGNAAALDLWGLDWDAFTQIPSRKTAEPLEREARDRLLARVREQGFIDDYRGVRVTADGKRFLIEKATVWNLFDEEDRLCGQAAAFSRWTLL